VLGSKTEYDKFKDADASYQHREGYKIVIEPTSSVYIHENVPQFPRRKIDTAWLTEGKRGHPEVVGPLESKSNETCLL
jgi:hypothetical protein